MVTKNIYNNKLVSKLSEKESLMRTDLTKGLPNRRSFSNFLHPKKIGDYVD